MAAAPACFKIDKALAYDFDQLVIGDLEVMGLDDCGINGVDEDLVADAFFERARAVGDENAAALLSFNNAFMFELGVGF
jgi:hypothetical protein